MLNRRSKPYGRLITTAAAALVLYGPQDYGAVFWNESIGGDLSNAQASPTPFTLSSGVNSVVGTVNGSTDVQDWLTLTVPSGFRLSGVTLSSFNSTDDIVIMAL